MSTTSVSENLIVPTISASEGLVLPHRFLEKKFCVYFCIEISYSYDILLYWSTGAGEIDKKIDEDDKINIRASSILRPRAVLSSPGNFT